MSDNRVPKGKSAPAAGKAVKVKKGAAPKRRGLMIVCSVVAAAAIAVGIFIEYPTSDGAATAPAKEAEAPVVQKDRIGTIVVESGTKRCQRKIFDNGTGRIVESNPTCENDVVLDANGMPIPQGTIHTLNSISNSFSK